ncbi:hypothetical protein [Neiella marina]|uniref:hypothetical protein n=1 Tax=Neiella marina TaxID=508461 RepID=UPI001180887E|nr:hypothetical protein [Neiella marina]
MQATPDVKVSMVKKISTDQASPQKFRPHGRFEYEPVDEDGTLLHVRCEGPFDAELLTAIKDIQQSPVLLNPCRKEIFQFSGCCIGIEEFVESATDYVGQLKRDGRAPKAVALVMPEELQGAWMMRDTYAGIYQRFNIPVTVVTTVTEAMQWLKDY